MLSTGQATSSTSNFQLIVNALADYTRVTGIEISTSPFATVFETTDSPEDILKLLQGRAKAFQRYRDGNRKLINCLKPAVKIIQAFSKIIEEAVSLVSHTSCCLARDIDLVTDSRQVPFKPGKALFVGIETLLTVRPLTTLFDHFPVMCECARLPVRLHRPMMPSSISLSAWRNFSSAWRFIRRSLPLR